MSALIERHPHEPAHLLGESPRAARGRAADRVRDPGACAQPPRVPRTLKGHAGGVLAIAVTPDGRHAVSGCYDGTLKVWELESGREPRTLKGHTGKVSAVAVTPDGRRVVSASWDKTLKVWELESDREPMTLQGNVDPVNAVAVIPDGRWAISASDDNTLKVWQLESGATIATFSCDAFAKCCAVANDGTIVAGDAGGRVHILALER